MNDIHQKLEERNGLMISNDVALGLAVFFLYLAMMLRGLFETFWPSEPRDDLPGGGHRVRKRVIRGPVPVREMDG